MLVNFKLNNYKVKLLSGINKAGDEKPGLSYRGGKYGYSFQKG